MTNLNTRRFDATTMTPEVAAAAQKAFTIKVFGWMTAALGITAIVAMLTATMFGDIVFQNRGLFWGLFAGQILIVIALSWGLNRMSAATATVAFILYSALVGLTFSGLLMLYSINSIYTTFFVTAGVFGLTALYGYVTSRDLTSIGSLCFMLLIGLCLATLVNMFWANSMLYWICTYAGVVIFVGLTAYDTQKIRQMALGVVGDAEGTQKAAIYGALALYLDFINLLIMLLRIMGNRR